MPTFRTRFSGTAVKRIGRNRFLRNVAYALGNSGTPSESLPAVERLLQDESPLVRGAAVWALSRLAPDEVARRSQTAEDFRCRRPRRMGGGAPAGSETMTFKRRAMIAGAALMLAAGSAMAQQPNSPARIAEILASPDRSAADRTNDQRRKPADMLAFIAIAPGITALDLSAGGGYTTELLARSIGPSGAVYGRKPAAARPQPAGTAPRRAGRQCQSDRRAGCSVAAPATPPAPPRPSPVALADRNEKMKAAGVAAAPITALSRPFEDPVPAELADGRFDLVTLMFNYHDLGFLGVDRAKMNAAAFKALKKGGFYVIADHSGRPGTGISESGTLHRIEEAFLREEVEAAGFKLVAEGNFLRNPNDPRDKNTPDPPQPKDEFVLKFREA